MRRITSMEALILPGILFILLPQLTIFEQLDENLRIEPITILLDGLILTGFWTVIIILLNQFCKRYVHISLIRMLYFCIIFYCIISTFNPVSVGVADMKGFVKSLNVYILLINAILACSIYYFFFHKYNDKAIMLLLVILFTTCAFFSVSNVLRDIKVEKSNLKLGKNNLLVFSFDGVPGQVLSHDMVSAQSTAFKDFTIYDSAVSHSPATIASLYSEILGDINWKRIHDTESELLNLYETLKTTSQLSYLSDASLYGYYSVFKHDVSKAFPSTPQKTFDWQEYYTAISNVELISASLCRVGFCSLGKKYGWFANYVRYVNDLFDRKMISEQVLDFYALTKIIRTMEMTDRDSAVFLGHFTFSHYPIVHDEKCNFPDRAIPQNYVSITNQSKCVLSTMENILLRLKQIGAYDNSLIVFKSDHGKPSSYYDKSTLNGKTIFNKENIWGYDRYRPFLLIKEPMRYQTSPKKEEDIFFLGTLSNLYCEWGAKNIRPSNINCRSVLERLGEQYDISEIDRNVLYLPTETSHFRYDFHDAIEAPDTMTKLMSLFESWVVLE